MGLRKTPWRISMKVTTQVNLNLEAEELTALKVLAAQRGLPFKTLVEHVLLMFIEATTEEK
jgi:predicted DNA binding CopG/RHH family protein